MERKYLAIDLKSFYASVECVERGLDPLKTNLVVADESRTSKTICLAVSPSLKSLGVPGRPRLFEVIHDVNEINKNRRYKLQREFTGSSGACMMTAWALDPPMPKELIPAARGLSASFQSARAVLM